MTSIQCPIAYTERTAYEQDLSGAVSSRYRLFLHSRRYDMIGNLVIHPSGVPDICRKAYDFRTRIQLPDKTGYQAVGAERRGDQNQAADFSQNVLVDLSHGFHISVGGHCQNQGIPLAFNRFKSSENVVHAAFAFHGMMLFVLDAYANPLTAPRKRFKNSAERTDSRPAMPK